MSARTDAVERLRAYLEASDLAWRELDEGTFLKHAPAE